MSAEDATTLLVINTDEDTIDLRFPMKPSICESFPDWQDPDNKGRGGQIKLGSSLDEGVVETAQPKLSVPEPVWKAAMAHPGCQRYVESRGISTYRN